MLYEPRYSHQPQIRLPSRDSCIPLLIMLFCLPPSLVTRDAASAHVARVMLPRIHWLSNSYIFQYFHFIFLRVTIFWTNLRPSPYSGGRLTAGHRLEGRRPTGRRLEGRHPGGRHLRGRPPLSWPRSVLLPHLHKQVQTGFLPTPTGLARVTPTCFSPSTLP